MIYKVSGTLIMKDGGKVAVNVNGVAYEISLSMNSYASLPSLHEKVELYTHFVLREDGAYLYGFTTLEEKSLFLLLNTVSKIGPKMALSILSNIGGTELANAVVSANVARLSSVPGIGKKTAERIIVELKDKLVAATTNQATAGMPKSVHADVLSALCNLGYKQQDCEKILAEFAEEKDFQTLFRKCLSKLMR